MRQYAGLILIMWTALAFWGAWATIEVAQAVHQDGKQDGLAECRRAKIELVYYRMLADSLCSWYYVDGVKTCYAKHSRTTPPLPEVALP